MKREIKELRRRIWRDLTGCKCPNVVRDEKTGTKMVVNRYRCTPSAIHCNERLARIYRDFEKHGLKIGPVAPGESGLAEKEGT